MDIGGTLQGRRGESFGKEPSLLRGRESLFRETLSLNRMISGVSLPPDLYHFLQSREEDD